MGLLDGFGLFRHPEQTQPVTLSAVPPSPVSYASLERKIDLLLHGLQITQPDVADAGLPQDVLELLAQGRKIEAIKHYRDQTGVGLKEAKDAVEGVGPVSASVSRLEHKLDLIMNELGIVDTASAAPQNAPIYDDIEMLVRSNQKIEAIKRYRDRNGVGLKEAKDVIDDLAARLGV